MITSFGTDYVKFSPLKPDGHSVLHTKHIMSLLQGPIAYCCNGK